MGKASRRKAQGRSQSLLARARASVQTITGAKDIRLLKDVLPQEEKISHALAALLTTEVPEGYPLDEYRAALDFIVLAWNISLLNAGEQAHALHQLAVPREGKEDALPREALDQIERLMARKQAMFPHDQRFVLAAEIQFRGSKLHVTGIASASPSKLDAVL